ncbi:MAG TPA: LysM peptidoglycan-binding domain-containing protein, partial [Candidatus Deferrimicrobiaceae bacterium]
SGDEAVPGKELSTEQVETALKRFDEGGRRTRTVRVRKGDTLSRIAKRTGVSVGQLAAANGLRTESRLKAGSRLRLPGSGSRLAKKSVVSPREGKKERRHVVRRGDTLSKISKTYGVTPQQISERNHLKEGQAPRRGRVLHIPLES